MLMTTIIHPEAFDRSHFAIPGYRDQAEMLFQGLQSNGLTIVDPKGWLLDELVLKIAGLSTKDGQQLQIRLAEFQKNRNCKVIKTHSSVCQFPPMAALLDIARRLRDTCKADAIILDAANKIILSQLGVAEGHMTLLAEYIRSEYEDKRRRYMEDLPPVDTMPPGDFDGHMIRCTRFAQLLRFYDKQIGHGNVSGFRLGIGKIMGLWVANAHYPRASLSAEIFTCVQKTYDPIDVVHRKILDSLVRKLAADHGIPVTLYFKEDTPAITHDRYLQTNSVAVCFSKGFDYVEGNGTLHRCTTKIDNGAVDHLQEYRRLKDQKPPTS